MDDENIFFLDESGFSLSTRRDKGWSYKGSKANVVVPAIRSRNISTVAAISNSGLLYFETKYAAYNAASFDKFLTNFFQLFGHQGYQSCCYHYGQRIVSQNTGDTTKNT